MGTVRAWQKGLQRINKFPFLPKLKTPTRIQCIQQRVVCVCVFCTYLSAKASVYATAVYVHPPYTYSRLATDAAAPRLVDRDSAFPTLAALAEERVDEQVVPRLVLGRVAAAAAVCSAAQHLQGVGLLLLQLLLAQLAAGGHQG